MTVLLEVMVRRGFIRISVLGGPNMDLMLCRLPKGGPSYGIAGILQVGIGHLLKFSRAFEKRTHALGRSIYNKIILSCEYSADRRAKPT